MSRKPIPGSVLLFIDPAGGTSYDTVVCGRKVGKQATVNSIDAGSSCGPAKLPGTLDISFDFEGVVLQSPEADTISATDLRIIMYSKNTIGFKICPEGLVTGDEIESGVGFISDISTDYSYNDVATFTMTIQPLGTTAVSEAP